MPAPWKVLSFDAEPTSSRIFTDTGQTVTLKPDAFLHLATGDVETFTFLEVDRSTESLAVIRRKAELYARYWGLGIEQRRLGLFPRVLFLVPDAQRQEAVTDTLAELPAECWRLFRVGQPTDRI